MTKPGIYKVIWHNQYSYLKSKVIKYRLRVLERVDLNQAAAKIPTESVEDVFTINELSERES